VPCLGQDFFAINSCLAVSQAVHFPVIINVVMESFRSFAVTCELQLQPPQALKSKHDAACYDHRNVIKCRRPLLDPGLQ